MVVAFRRAEVVELYGLVDVDEHSPFWPEVIPEEAANAMPLQAKIIAREKQRLEKDVLADLYREYFRQKGMLTTDQRGLPATRRGTIREVERFHAALKSLLERAHKASLPSETGRRQR